jgi:hypothetical protein
VPYSMYVSLQDDDKILVFAMDAETGKLIPKSDVPIAGGPSSSAISPDRKPLYMNQSQNSLFKADTTVGGSLSLLYRQDFQMPSFFMAIPDLIPITTAGNNDKLCSIFH